MGAIAVGSVAFALAGKLKKSYLGTPMSLPASRAIDKRRVLGALAFGIGWGIAGICPGPALVLLGAGSVKGVMFVAAILLGMGVFEILERRHSNLEAQRKPMADRKAGEQMAFKIIEEPYRSCRTLCDLRQPSLACGRGKAKAAKKGRPQKGDGRAD